MFGVRLNLDDIEQLVGGTAARPSPETTRSSFSSRVDGERSLAPRVTELADRLKLHWSGFEMRGIPALPLLSNGKVDYRALESAR